MEIYPWPSEISDTCRRYPPIPITAPEIDRLGSLDAYLVPTENRLTGKFLLFLAWLVVERVLSKDHVPNTMKVLSDAKSLIMFQIIAASSPHGLRTTELNRGLQISLKQLYLRISNLVNAGLTRRW